MSTLDELKYYCMEENTFGALMLTGEWGCGKTYLIDNLLPEELGENYIIIRVSLFGFNTVSDIQTGIQKAYFHKVVMSSITQITDKSEEDIEKLFNGKTGTFLKLLLNTGKKIPKLETLLSFNPEQYFPIEPIVGGKKIIFVFDDIERCEEKEVLILGCINEYCENKKIKTILVANEKVLQDKTNDNSKENTNSKLNYNEIKEKLITRTVKYEPDYSEILSAIIHKYKTSNSDYKFFLQNQIDTLISVLNIGKSKNLRSIKCSIQDFERIYTAFNGTIEETDVKIFFSSFVSFVQLYKDGKIIKSDNYGDLLINTTIAEEYPGLFNNHYMFNSIEDWIMCGVWNSDYIKKEIQQFIERGKPTEPKDILKSYDLIHIDENTINIGFNEYLDMAYKGRLTLDEYIMFLFNQITAREIGYTFPTAIDISKINEGVKKVIQQLLKDEELDAKNRNSLSKEHISLLTEEEKEIYNLIDSFRNDDIQIYEINKRNYIKALNDYDMHSIYEAENKRYNAFDKDIREAVFKCFSGLSNANRMQFTGAFKSTWCAKLTLNDKEQLTLLKSAIEESAKNYADKNMHITSYLFRRFALIVTELLPS